MNEIQFSQPEQQKQVKKEGDFKQWFPKEFLAGCQIRVKSFKFEKKGDKGCYAKYFNPEGYTGRFDFTDVYGVARFMYIHSKAFMNTMSEAKIHPNQLGVLYSRKEQMQTPRGTKDFWNWDFKLLEDVGQK